MKMNQNVEFNNLKRKLDRASTTKEKIGILEQLVKVDPPYPFLAMQKKKFRQKLEALKLGGRKKPVTNTRDIYQFKRGKYQACLIGATNSGKSALLARLTKASPVISDAPFTTYKPEIGSMDYNGVEIQLVEVPAIFEGDSERDENKYRFIKQADLKIVVTNNPTELETILLELWNRTIMLGEDEGVKGLVVYREKAPDTIIPKVEIKADVKEAIYRELGLMRIYVSIPMLERPISFRNEEVDIARIKELLEKKNKLLGYASILVSNRKWKQVASDYKLNDGDHIKFQM